MDSLYTLKNVYDLLAKNFIKCEWKYEIYDEYTMEKKKATIEDFTKSMGVLLKVVLVDSDGREDNIFIKVTNFNFELYHHVNRCCSEPEWELSNDLSKIWRELLVYEYGDKYEKYLLLHKDEEEQEMLDYTSDFNLKQDAFSND